MYRIPIYRVTLVREATHSAPTRTITNPHDAEAILRGYLGDADREHFLLVMLDTRHRVIGLNTVSVGALASSIVHPREVFKPCLLANCAAILVAHNHPSGDPEPSHEDLALTTRLKHAGELLGIPVLDHLILGDGAFVSLKERGNL